MATYAKLLGRFDEAARFGEFDDRDKAVDKRLTEIAQNTVNPATEGYAPPSHVPPGARPH